MHCLTCFFFIYALLCIAYDLRSHSVPLMVHLLFVLPGLIVFGNQLHGALQACALTAQRMISATSADASSTELPLWHPIWTALLPLLPGLLALLISRLSREALGLGDGLFLLIAGLYLQMRSMLLLLLSGILVGFLVSVILLVYPAGALRVLFLTVPAGLIPFPMQRLSLLPTGNLLHPSDDTSHPVYPWMPCFIY